MSQLITVDRATLEQLVGALEGVRLCTPPAQRPMVREAITAGRAALANAEPTQSKPVAYITDTHQGPMVWTPEMYGEALEKLARLGNGDQYGNSDGNMIARSALAKYKGAK